MTPKIKLFFLTLACLNAALAAVVGTAAAANTANPCGYSSFTQPFSAFGDSSWYVPVSGGTFESPSPAWLLSGASTTNSNETYYVTSPSDTRSLSLPSGSSATSPSTCVAVNYQTMRFFAVNTGSPFSTLRVDVLFPKPGAGPATQTLGRVTSSGSWAPSPAFRFYAGAFGASTGSTNVTFRFTVEGAGSWKIDDVYVDPRVQR